MIMVLAVVVNMLANAPLSGGTRLILHLFETIKHPVQIEIGGKLVLTYERSLQKLTSAKKKEPWFAIVVAMIFLILLIFIYITDRKRHESRNS